MDVAVGPFSFARGNRNEEYNQLLDIHEIREFLSRVVKRGKTLTKDFIKSVKDSENKNPRCFICIEVENKSTRKHFMGSAFNSSIMGKVGIVISYDEGKMEKVFSYLKEMIMREKLSPKILDNVIWITKEKFDEIMKSYD